MSTTIDQQFVEFVVKSLVSKPDAVQVERRIDEKGVLLELTVDPEDLGRVIGKRGATAQSLRTLLRALGTKNEARYNLKIIDNGEPREDRRHNDSDENRSDNQPAREESSEPAEQNDELPAATADEAPAVSDEPPLTATPADDDDEDMLDSLGGQEEDHSDVVSKTRRELEELDDLDV